MQWRYCSIRDIIAKIIGESFVRQWIQEEDTFIDDLSFQIDTYLKQHILQYVILHELQILENGHYLMGDTPEQREQYFVSTVSNTKEWNEYLNRKYPLMQAIIDNFLSDICEFVCSLLKHFSSDYNEISRFCDISDLKLVRLVLFLGDLHRKGKCVAKLTFVEGVSVFYKPRNFRNENRFVQIIDEINDVGFEISAGAPQSIDKNDHSWVKEVKPCNVPPNFDDKVYYRNLGRLLCILHTLGISDIIPDNIICSGGIPNIIDIECVHGMYPRDIGSSFMANKMAHSVSEIGMLPKWVFTSLYERGELLSVFYKTENNIHHLPHCDNHLYEMSQSTEKVFTDGFRECYEFILGHKSLLVKWKKYFSNNQQRMIIHDTVLYSYLLRELCLPETLNGKNSIHPLIQNLIPNCFKPFSELFVDSIYKQLMHFDIPFFSIQENGTMVDGYGVTMVENINMLPSFENDISREDLSFQMQVINASIAIGIELKTSNKRTEDFHLAEDIRLKSVSIENACLSAARQICEELWQYRQIGGNEVNWVAKSFSHLDGKYQANILDGSLYSGLSGMAILFECAQQYLAESKYGALADCIREELTDYADRLDMEDLFSVNGKRSPLKVSFYDFPFSLAYLSLRCGQNLKNEDFITKTLEMADKSFKYDIQDCGYLGGIAGYLDLLIELKRTRTFDVPDKFLFSALNVLLSNEEKNNGMSCWKHSELIKGNENVVCFGGFAHGTSGIAYVLFKLFKLTGDEKIFKSFESALKYDRFLYDSEIQGWYDVRKQDNHYDMAAWCHGSGGVALSRLLLMEEGYQDAIMPSELQTAAKNLFIRKGETQTVCHGDVGNMEILYGISMATNDEILRNEVLTHVKSLAGCIINDVPMLYGDRRHTPSIGLFLGRAGLAYQMMRFARWDSIPSNLFCDHSKRKSQIFH